MVQIGASPPADLDCTENEIPSLSLHAKKGVTLILDQREQYGHTHSYRPTSFENETFLLTQGGGKCNRLSQVNILSTNLRSARHSTFLA